MTVLGKIFAILNLVLSLAVAAFIVMTYVSRTNWHDAFLKQQKAVADGQQVLDLYKADADQARGELAKKETELAKVKTNAAGEEKKHVTQITQLRDDLAKETTKKNEFQTAQTSVAAELNRRQQEVDYLKTLKVNLEDKVKVMEAKVQDLTNSATENLIAKDSEQQRNNRLLEENERLTRELQKAQQAGPVAGMGGGTKKNPPLDDIEGIIKSTDPASGYVTISIGSDAGLVKGNTLEVYRLKPDPLYLGTIEILALRPDQAVGKPITKMRGVMQIGDRVSSTIVSKR
jgi:hypothetical protein